ncbi:MAG: hypothetical protein PVSMB4_01360 [Ktedonobacterales bacterium]
MGETITRLRNVTPRNVSGENKWVSWVRCVGAWGMLPVGVAVARGASAWLV